jgi:hypothetical protein
MRRGSMLVLVLTMVFSLLAMVPVSAVTTPDSDAVVWQEADAQRVVENRFK